MAHKTFAELDASNNVLNVIVVDDSTISRELGDPSSERICKKLFKGYAYKESKPIGSDIDFRVRAAAKEGVYNPVADRFEGPQVYEGWSKRESDGEWEPPFEKPSTKPTEVTDFEALHPERGELNILWINDELLWRVGYMNFDTNEWVQFRWGESDTDWVRSVAAIPEGEN
jgi:hypothetical protein|tara:strand:- start:610 stop:1122 length:513 start_codon:yes stop_codon:yes gene_type:complete